MKKLITIVLVASSLISLAQKKEVKIKVQQFIPYCGGIKPPQSMLDAANQPQPYANMTLIYKNAKGKVDSVRTNDSSRVVLHLNAGTYRFYEAWQYYKKLPDASLMNNYDKKCMANQWAKPILKITVDSKTTSVDNLIGLKRVCPHQQPCAIKKHLPE